MTNYVVTAPYITAKVVDDAGGGYVLRGFYTGAVIPGDRIHGDSLKHHLDGDMLAEVDAPAVAEEQPEPDVTLAGDTPRPHGNASQATWLEYAVSKRADGVSEEDARAALSEKTRAELVAEFGG